MKKTCTEKKIHLFMEKTLSWYEEKFLKKKRLEK